MTQQKHPPTSPQSADQSSGDGGHGPRGSSIGGHGPRGSSIGGHGPRGSSNGGHGPSSTGGHGPSSIGGPSSAQHAGSKSGDGGHGPRGSSNGGHGPSSTGGRGPNSIGGHGPNSTGGQTVARQAGRMGLATLLSRFAGLFREQVFAHLFGATDVADAFNIAFRIPNLLRDLFAEGAMSAAFVPVFTRRIQKNKAEAFRLLWGCLWSLFLIVTTISIVGGIFSEPLVSLYAGAYRNTAGKFELAVNLTRSMFPFFPFVALAALLMGALNAMGAFFLPAFSPVLFNLASIFAGIVVCPLLSHFTTVAPIYGMAWGVVVGGFLQFFLQFIQVRRLGFQWSQQEYWNHWRAPWKVDGVKEVLWLVVPGTVGLAATQVNILLNSIFATSHGAGAVSYLNYAFRLMQFPIGIFGVSLAAATLPQVTRMLVGGSGTGVAGSAEGGVGAANISGGSGTAPSGGKFGTSAAAQEVAKALRMCMAINGPAAAGLMGAGIPIIGLLFQHGAFNSFATEQTALALFFYALGLPGYSALKILVPLFYSVKDARTPVKMSFVMVGLNAALNAWFLYAMALPFWSLAMATAFTSTLNAFVLVFLLEGRIAGILTRQLLKVCVQYLIISAAIFCFCLICAWGVDSFVAWLMLQLTLVQRQWFIHQWFIWIIKLSFSMGGSVVIWFAMGRWLALTEIETVYGIVARRLGYSYDKV